MSQYTQTITNIPRETNDEYYNFLKSSGFRIFEYQEEPQYAEAFDSWRNKAPSARYHFVEMITEGGHGIPRPLTNLEIIQFHSDLTNEKIDSLRAVYNLNGSIRPFKRPMQISRAGISQQEINKINSQLESFYQTVKSVAPIIMRDIPTYVAASLDVRLADSKGTSVTTTSQKQPSFPEVGDIWFNTLKGKYFAYLADGKSKYWVEV
jgi:hypothetical protein